MIINRCSAAAAVLTVLLSGIEAAALPVRVLADPSQQYPYRISTTSLPPRQVIVTYPVHIDTGVQNGRAASPVITNRPSNGGRAAYPGYPVVPGFPSYSANYYPSSPAYPAPVLPGATLTFIQPDGVGGYEFGNYSQSACGDSTVPSIYGLYSGVPGYIYVDEGYVQDILPVSGGYTEIPDAAAQSTGAVDSYNTVNNYTVNNYYTAPAATAGQPAAAAAAQPAPSATGSDAAFADIQQAWVGGDIEKLIKHLPVAGGKIAVALQGKNIYDMESAHFTQITEDAFSNLTTYGFVRTSLKSASDGSVTGYFTHTYAPSSDTSGTRNTMYLSFTIANTNGVWIVTGIDSSISPLTGSMDDGASTLPSLSTSANK